MENEKKSIVGPVGRTMLTFVLVLVIYTVGAVTGVMIADENPKCPDCNLICPDVIDYGEDNSELMNRLNQTIRLLELMEQNITYDLSWLEYDHDLMNYKLGKIRNETIDLNVYQYPQDYIAIVNYTDNTSLQIEYYDNFISEFQTSPMFTIENWTELVEWAQSKGDARLYPLQRQMIFFIAIHMAYYKETGTWLGE